MLEPSLEYLKNFEFESGDVLEELKMEYTTFGTAKRDDNGNVTNGVLFIHGSSGDYGSVKRFQPIMGPGKAIDTDRYFIICTSSLGSGGSSKPSNSGFGPDFPRYTVKDMAHAQYRLLNEKLSIKHLKGVVGTSLGGFLSLEWAVRHPDFLDFIIPIVTGPSVRGRNLAMSVLCNSMIENHPDYQHGRYSHNPKDVLENVSKLEFLFVFADSYYHKEFSDDEELLLAFNEQGVEGGKVDANDVVWRNHAAISYNLESELSKIRAKTLIIGIEGDNFFPPELDAIPLSKVIADSELFLYRSRLGHLGINEVEKMESPIERFLSQF